MRRAHPGTLAITLCGLLLALVGCGSSGGNTGATGSPTTNGSTHCSTPSSDVMVDGVSTVKFCGPAKAQASFNGQPANWLDGNCLTEGGIFTVNIGQEAVDGNPNDLKKFDYFGLDIPSVKGDGPYEQAVITGVYHGQQFALGDDSVTVTENLTAGSFIGTDLTTQGSVSGSFSCK